MDAFPDTIPVPSSESESGQDPLNAPGHAADRMSFGQAVPYAARETRLSVRTILDRVINLPTYPRIIREEEVIDCAMLGTYGSGHFKFPVQATIIWQVLVMSGPGKDGAADMWEDLSAWWAGSCERTYELVSTWKDEMWRVAEDRDALPQVRGDEVGSPHTYVQFHRTGAWWMDINLGSRRSVRRIAVTLGFGPGAEQIRLSRVEACIST